MCSCLIDVHFAETRAARDGYFVYGGYTETCEEGDRGFWFANGVCELAIGFLCVSGFLQVDENGVCELCSLVHDLLSVSRRP